MKILSRLFSGAALIALASTAANATSIIGYNASQAASTNSGFTLTLNKFDTGLGTLNSVTIYFAATLNETNITITSTDSSTEAFDYAASDNFTKTFVNSAVTADKLTGENVQVFDTGIGGALGNCSGNSGSTVRPNPTLGCDGITLAAGATTGNLAPYSVSNTDANYGLTIGTAQNGLVGVTISGSVLTAYEAAGGGTFTLSGTTQSGSSGDEQNSGTINDVVINTSTQQFAAEVDYNYSSSSAPEPGTMMLLGSALVGLGLIRSHRSKKT
jgi:hypothetical protein